MLELNVPGYWSYYKYLIVEDLEWVVLNGHLCSIEYLKIVKLIDNKFDYNFQEIVLN